MDEYGCLTPDRRQLIERYMLAFSQLFLVERPKNHATTALQPRELRWSVDERAAQSLAESLESFAAAANSAQELIAGVAIRVSRAPVLKFSDREVQRRIQLEAGVQAATALADRLGFRLGCDARAALSRSLRPVPIQATQVHATVASGLSPASARPRVLILTPLTQVKDDAEHARLLEPAYVIRERLQPLGLSVDIPGERLHPDTGNNWAFGRMYAVERQRILRADFVVILLGSHQSWGAAQAMTWAEQNLAVVVAFTAQGSRVLSGGFYPTSTLPFSSPDDMAEEVLRRVKRELPGLRSRALAGAQLRRTWASEVVRHGDNALSPGTERYRAATKDPHEFLSLSVRELLQLNASAPEWAQRTLRTLMESTLRGDYAATDDSENAFIHFRLSPAEAAALDNVCFRKAVSANERALLLHIAQVTAEHPQLIAARRHYRTPDWIKMLQFIRSTSGQPL